jgi:Ser/Thr protein kinase RdoA (MazF antagonist)
MAHFPVSSSNLSAQHLGRFIREQYELEGDVHCRLLRSGINDTYAIRNGEDEYVFRVYSLDWRTKTEIQEEINLLLLLKENNIEVSYPIPSGLKYIMNFNAPEGERMGVLFSFAKGEKNQDLSNDMHRRIGELMANMHQVTDMLQVKRTSYTSEVLFLESLQHIRKFLSYDSAEMAFMRSVQAWLATEFNKIQTHELRKGVVHLDIWFDNLNNDEGKITLFDFDFCGNGWLCLDVAYYIMQVFYTERDETICREKVDSFLSGYESITPLSEEEKRILPMLGVSLYFFYLGVQCRRYDNWSNVFLSEHYLKRYINFIIKRYMDLQGLKV